MIQRLKENSPLSELHALFPEAGRFISVITRIELLSYHGITAAEEDRIRQFLEGVTVVPLLDEIEQTAISFRRARKRKTPDSIIAATAIALDAALVTMDSHFLTAAWPGLQTLSIA
jgi:predicted nucleic acid-binding protein